MSRNDGGPAFPNVPNDPAYVTWDYGMSLLEYYAGQALPQCIDIMRAAARKTGVAGFDFDNSPSRIAGAAFDIAAAMVAESQKRKGGAA